MCKENEFYSSPQRTFSTIHDETFSVRKVDTAILLLPNRTVYYLRYLFCILTKIFIQAISLSICFPFRIGETPNTSSIPSDMANPCQNRGIYFHNITIPQGYFCEFPSGFNGANCELDI
jgi:hypothetical protein